jgi:hypothetical protein
VAPTPCRFQSLVYRVPAVLGADTVTLTPAGETLVQAIIDSEF